ncbi:cytochrome P450 [Nesidiocoris tenuis]|uniref:Cytochrome P450 n=1 Tax=Nesidiocoris tenuis TaxID=355587 RepID=A0ABN7AKV5_9HEMI|nr:cytochrome P450 [Nesidiocoris tenuis]
MIAIPFSTVFLVVLVTVLLNIFFFPSLRTIKYVMKLPGPPQWPLIGVSIELARTPLTELMAYLQNKVINGYKRVAHVWLLGVPMVFVNSPQDIEVILSSVKHIEKGMEYFSLKAWLNEGLLLSTGKKWHTRRKLLTPTFHFKILDDKCSTMYSSAKKMVENFLKEDGKPFNPLSKISSCTLDVVAEAAMGVSLNSQDNENAEYVSTIARTTWAAVFRVLNLYLKQDWLWNLTPIGRQDKKDVEFLHGFTEKIIKERKVAYHDELYKRSKQGTIIDSENDLGVKKKQAFLDKLLELDADQAMSNADIREEVDTFLFEGHDTTASAVNFCLYELGRHPEIQEKAYQEQLEIFGDDDREITLSDMQNMNYLDRFVKETLRLYPSVPYISRTITEDIHLKDFPTLIPAGSNAIITPFYLHRNPDYFPDPEKFDPDRFLPENCAKRHPFAYIPFSGGPRNCIGQKFAMMEIKVTLSTVLRLSQIRAASKHEELNLAPVVILRNLGSMKIQVYPRSSSS